MILKTLAQGKILIQDVREGVTFTSDNCEETVQIHTTSDGFNLRYKGNTYIISKGIIMLVPEPLKYNNKLESESPQIALFD